MRDRTDDDVAARDCRSRIGNGARAQAFVTRTVRKRFGRLQPAAEGDDIRQRSAAENTSK